MTPRTVSRNHSSYTVLKRVLVRKPTVKHLTPLRLAACITSHPLRPTTSTPCLSSYPYPLPLHHSSTPTLSSITLPSCRRKASLGAAFVKIWALALLSLSLSPLCSASAMLGLSVLWLLSPVFSLSLFPAHSTPPSSFPLASLCRCHRRRRTSMSDCRAVPWWSPFDFQDLKLSPNDLKYPFFLLPHFFFANTKNRILKGQS